MLSICYDFVFVVISIYIANILRLKTFDVNFNVADVVCMLITAITTIFCFIRLGMYRAVLRYIMIPALSNIFIAVVLSAITLSISSFFLGAFLPRSVPIIYALLAMILLGFPRVLVRSVYFYFYRKKKPNVIIYGAGATGRDLAYSLINGKKYNPVVILDDDLMKSGEIICGLRVHHSDDFEKLMALYNPEKLLFAINNISKGQRLRLIEKTSYWPIEVQSVPSVEDIALGKATEGDVRDLYISDLLGRNQIDPDNDLMQKNIFGKNILITGAGGSIGSELCRQIILQKPKKIILFELNEFNLYSIDQELKTIKNRLNITCDIISALGSVQHKKRMTRIMQTYYVDTVYHAAAYKHVPIVEDNIIEGVRNNVFGTLATAQAAIEAKVKNFTLISTDKAVRPTNIMGATKRLAELILQALAEEQQTTIFTMVRFGNVLDSSGSVVPLFKKQIRSGGPVTVTHPEIIRYFMLIPEAAQLVIQAGAMSKSGQVFVLDMGNPVKILLLAQRMIKLMGLSYYCLDETQNLPNEGDIEIAFTGLRAGEKLYEELLIGDNVCGTSHSKIMAAKEVKLTWCEIEVILNQLDNDCHDGNVANISKLIKSSNLIGYIPNQ